MTAQLPIKRWSHLCLRVTDVDRSLAFYRDVLGFETLVDIAMGGDAMEKIVGGISGATGRMVIGRVGGQRLELMELDGVPLEQGPRDPADGVHAFPYIGMGSFTFQVESIAAAYEACRKHAIATEGEPVEMTGFKLFFINDPDGVRIELAEYPPGQGP